jgi:hypothetical protein
MDDEYTKKIEKSFFRKLRCKIFNAGYVFQSIWIRYNSISAFVINREYLVCQYNFVLYIGSLFWIVFLLSKTF